VLITCPPALATALSYVDRLRAMDIDVRLADVVQQLSEDELLALLGDVDGMIAGDDPLTERVLAGAPRLRVIVRWGVGLDNVNVDAARALGIRVVNTPGVFGEEVADVAIGYLIMLARRLHDIDKSVRRGEWAKPQGRSLAGMTLGLVGLGTIGRAVARRAIAMRMSVVGCDVSTAAQANASAENVVVLPIEEVFARSNAIILCSSLTADNRGAVDAALLERMPPRGWLINVARGGLIDEDSLVAALQSGHLSGAALDVFADEPLPRGSRFSKLDQVILGSHNASNTMEAVARVNDLAIEHLVRGLAEISR
jgi:D-3-phosphoglycerate dehydrogenase